MEAVYVVCASTGEYSNWEHWPVCVFRTEDAARAYCEECADKINEAIQFSESVKRVTIDAVKEKILKEQGRLKDQMNRYEIANALLRARYGASSVVLEKLTDELDGAYKVWRERVDEFVVSLGINNVTSGKFLSEWEASGDIHFTVEPAEMMAEEASPS